MKVEHNICWAELLHFFIIPEYTAILRTSMYSANRPNTLKILKFFGEKGYKTELTDARWLAKIFKDDYYIDIIFDTVNNICRVDDLWYKHAVKAELKVLKF